VSGMCRSLTAAAAVLAGLAMAAEADQPDAWLPRAAINAGAAELLALLPEEAFEGVAAQDAARAVLSASAPHYWQPIESAPRDRQILLGLRTASGFRIALGHWEVHDEVVLETLTGGEWSAAAWWGADPTHWSAIPPAPD
jgi:hypothetical protein